MAMNVGSIFVELGAKFDRRGFDQFDRSVKGSAKETQTFVDAQGRLRDANGRSIKSTEAVASSNKRLGSSFRQSAHSAAGFTAGFLGVGGLVSVLQQSVVEADQAAKAQRQVQASINSTRGVAGLTADEVMKMSDKLSGINFIDNDEIAKGASVMLTFKAVTKDTFETAMQASLDLQGKFGGDLQRNIVMMGKALQDPVRGITALRRVGVGFTKEQEAQIKVLVQNGQTAKAQGIILAEVNSQVGGSAAANTTPTQKFKFALKNLYEVVGKLLTPALTIAAKAITAFLALGPGAQAAFLVLGGAVVAAKAITALSAAFNVLKVAMMSNPWIVLATLAVGAAILIITNWDKVKKFLKKTWDWIKGAARDAGEFVLRMAKKGFLGPVPWIISNWDKVKKFFTDLPGILRRGLSKLSSIIVSPFVSAFNGLKGAISSAIKWMKTKFAEATSWLRKQYDKLPGPIKSALGFAKDAAGSVIGAVKNVFAEGGRVNGAQLAVVGEDGPEVIIPVGAKRKRRGRQLLQVAAQELGVQMFADGGIVGIRKAVNNQRNLIQRLEDDYDYTERYYGITGGETSPAELMNLRRRKQGIIEAKQLEAQYISALIRRLNNGEEKRQLITDLYELRKDIRDNRLDTLDLTNQVNQAARQATEERVGQAAAVAAQFSSFNSARFDTLMSFGGNTGALTTSTQAAAQAGKSSSPVVINNSYTQAPQDPAAWNKQVELQVRAATA